MAGGWWVVADITVSVKQTVSDPSSAHTTLFKILLDHQPLKAPE